MTSLIEPGGTGPAVRPQPGQVGRAARTRRTGFGVAVAVLAVAAAIWAVVGSAWILPELSANSDEGLYLLQADALESGRLAPRAPAVDPEAYQPWFSVVDGERYVLKYAPVHASVLAAADTVAGSPRPALGVLAAAQVLLVVALARELGASRRAAVAAGSAFALAPLVLQLDITYLSYGTSLTLLLAAATAGWRALRTRTHAAALLAGGAWGLAAFARPYDAALFGLALGAALLLRGRLERPAGASIWRLAAMGTLGAALPLVGLLAFNHAMTGSPLHLPFHLLEPRDAPGLGARRALPTDSFLDYTLGRAIESLGRNMLLVAVWGGGGVLGLVAALSTLLRRRLPGGALLAAVLVVWPVGYALFWGSYVAAFLWDGALFLGPFYFLPMVAMLAIAAGVGFDDLWRWRPPVAAVAVVGAVALSAAIAVPRLAEQHGRSEPREEVARAIEATVETPALVFVPPLAGPYLQNPLSFLRNDAELDGPIIYALLRSDEENAAVMAAHPGRRAYGLALPAGWSDDPGFDPMVEVGLLLTSEGS